MYLIFIFGLLCLGAASIALKFNRKIEETFSLFIFLIISILYIYGILGYLEIGVGTIILIGLISALFCGYSLYRDKNIFKTNILTPGFLMFFLFFALTLWAHNGRQLSSWDEFSHWGLTVKDIYTLNALSNHPDTTTQFKSYPPATALLQYFWVKLSGQLTESNLYRAINVLYFSLMVPIYRDLEWKHLWKIAQRTILVLILPLVFYSYFYIAILVDPILGVTFSYTLFVYYTNKMSTFKILNISLALFVLTLIKASGFGLAIISISIMVVDALFIEREDLKNYLIQNSKIKIFKRSIMLLFPMLFPVIAKYSWMWYLSLTKTKEFWDTSKIGVQSIGRIFIGSAPQYQYKVIFNFFKFPFETHLSDHILKMSFIGWIIFLLICSSILVKFICKEEEKGRFKVAFICLFIGAALYSITLLLYYLFSFSEYEAVIVASCGRYLSTYLLGMLIFLAVILFLKEQRSNPISIMSYSTRLLLIIFLITRIAPINDITLQAHTTAAKTRAERSIYEPITRINQIVNYKTDKVYFISIADTGFHYFVSRYNIAPVKTNVGFSWSIGKPYFEGDIWTANKNVDEWAEELKNEYTYVYIFRTNDGFNENYGKIFNGGSKSIKNDTLYHIDKNSHGITLNKVQLR